MAEAALAPDPQRTAELRIDASADERREGMRVARCLRRRERVDWRAVEEPSRVATRLRRLGMRRELARVLGPEPDAPAYEAIIGANDLMPARFLPTGARVARAIGRIRVINRRRLGTGFLVSPRLVMTNNHVIASAADGHTSELELDFFERANGAIGPVKSVALDPDAFFLTDRGLDFTVIAVDAGGLPALSGRGWLPLIAESGKAVVGERVNVIQHPGGQPQQVAIHDNTIAAVVGDWLHYVTDTEPGSSGSPVLNDEWELAALHHASRAEVNEGVRISRVVERVRELAVAAGVDQDLLAALLQGDAPPAGPVEAVEAPAPGTTTARVAVGAGASTLEIPITISVRVGPPAGPAAAAAPPVEPAPIEPPAISTALLDRSLGALRASEDAVYYDEDGDAAAREAYWQGVGEGLEGEPLLAAVSAHLAVTHHPVTSYRTARLVHLYPRVDLQPELDLLGVYTNERFTAEEVIRDEVATEEARSEALRDMRHEGLDADAALEALAQLEALLPYNTEHVVPQSWFEHPETLAPKVVMQCDLHHLFTCNSRCNSKRGNRAYYEFRARVDDACGEVAENRFEPRFSKSTVARAALYFIARYPREVRGGDTEMPAARIATLMRWARREAPSLWERHRNAEIASIQGNRNPFIDRPELVARLPFAAHLA